MEDKSHFCYFLSIMEAYYKEGSVLNGWRNEAGELLKTGKKIYIDEDVTFTADWADVITVTLDLDGGILDGAEDTAQIHVPKGGVIVINQAGNIYSFKDHVNHLS